MPRIYLRTKLFYLPFYLLLPYDLQVRHDSLYYFQAPTTPSRKETPKAILSLHMRWATHLGTNTFIYIQSAIVAALHDAGNKHIVMVLFNYCLIFLPSRFLSGRVCQFRFSACRCRLYTNVHIYTVREGERKSEIQSIDTCVWIHSMISFSDTRT